MAVEVELDVVAVGPESPVYPAEFTVLQVELPPSTETQVCVFAVVGKLS